MRIPTTGGELLEDWHVQTAGIGLLIGFWMGATIESRGDGLCWCTEVEMDK